MGPPAYNCEQPKEDKFPFRSSANVPEVMSEEKKALERRNERSRRAQKHCGLTEDPLVFSNSHRVQ